jgi:uncharacterized integral membrane protein
MMEILIKVFMIIGAIGTFVSGSIIIIGVLGVRKRKQKNKN